jgi:H+/Cl- antiporter ClcA
MHQPANQLLNTIQQAVATVFRLIQYIWTWSIDQIMRVAQSPWQSWPLWKQIVLALIIAAVAWALFQVVTQLWEVGERIISAFLALLGVLVRTLPAIAIAGAIALGGTWLLNNMDLSSIQLPRWAQLSP